MRPASQAARGDETVTERTTCSWVVRRVGCAGRLCSKVGANYVLLFMFFTYFTFLHCKISVKILLKIVAKIVCSKCFFQVPEVCSVKVVFVVPGAAKVAHNEGLQ